MSAKPTQATRRAAAKSKRMQEGRAKDAYDEWCRWLLQQPQMQQVLILDAADPLAAEVLTETVPICAKLARSGAMSGSCPQQSRGQPSRAAFKENGALRVVDVEQCSRPVMELVRQEMVNTLDAKKQPAQKHKKNNPIHLPPPACKR